MTEEVEAKESKDYSIVNARNDHWHQRCLKGKLVVMMRFANKFNDCAFGVEVI